MFRLNIKKLILTDLNRQVVRCNCNVRTLLKCNTNRTQHVRRLHNKLIPTGILYDFNVYKHKHFSLLNAVIRDFNTTSKHSSGNLTELQKDSENDDTGSDAQSKRFSKKVLSEIYDVVRTELKDSSLKPSTFATIKGKKTDKYWECGYHVKWPEDWKFSDTGRTKKDALGKAAVKLLQHLADNNHINNELKPNLYKKSETISKHNELALSVETTESLQSINEIYKTEFLPYLIDSGIDTNNKGDELGKDIVFEALPAFNRNAMRSTAINRYLANEPVQLPISQFKDDIISAVNNHQVTIIKGEPGCGKSTRIPQYILEAWALDSSAGENCRILVTQPRRIAAISLAERVANERQEMVGPTVGYQVRLKSNFNHHTGHILYCTTGILLRKIQSNPDLIDCTHIILDEAHERDTNTDLLMNLMRDVLVKNPRLKVLVMSATIDAEAFQNYFDDAAIVHIPGFTYPVKDHYLDKKMGLDRTMKMCQSDNAAVVPEDVAKMIMNIHKTREEGAILCFLPGWDDILKVSRCLPYRSRDMSILYLHSRIQDADQHRIFSKPPPGVRKIILATNIAETSVTIDDVVYVIDTGIQKDQRFDADKGLVCMDNHWISKASVAQRRGRAGRVQPGESFHLYPKSKYDEFAPFSMPEILRSSLTKIVLDSKVFSDNMPAQQFFSKLLSPPDTFAIQAAVNELKDLKLLDSQEKLTPLGRCLSEFQLEPKLAKAMVHAVIFKCVTPIVDIATLFSAETELFISGILSRDEMNQTKKKFDQTSDHLAMMRIFEDWLAFHEDGDPMGERDFCIRHNLLDYKMRTIRQLREIHFGYLEKGLNNAMQLSDNNSDEDELVKAVLLSGVGSVLQQRNFDMVKGRIKKANVLLTRHNHKATITSDSVNYKREKYPTNLIMYINETRSNIRRTTVVRETSLIPALTVLLFKNDRISTKEDENGKILLSLENSPHIKFTCSKADAELITMTKQVIEGIVDYYTHQLTNGGDPDPKLDATWDTLLSQIVSALKSAAL